MEIAHGYTVASEKSPSAKSVYHNPAKDCDMVNEGRV